MFVPTVIYEEQGTGDAVPLTGNDTFCHDPMAFHRRTPFVDVILDFICRAAAQMHASLDLSFVRCSDTVLQEALDDDAVSCGDSTIMSHHGSIMDGTLFAMQCVPLLRHGVSMQCDPSNNVPAETVSGQNQLKVMLEFKVSFTPPNVNDIPHWMAIFNNATFMDYFDTNNGGYDASQGGDPWSRERRLYGENGEP